MDLLNKDIEKLLKTFQQKKICDDEISKRTWALDESIGLPKNFEALSPVNRTHALALAMANGHERRPFLKATEKLNIMLDVQVSVKSVASGIRSYVRFCSLLGRAPPSPRRIDGEGMERNIQTRADLQELPAPPSQSLLPSRSGHEMGHAGHPYHLARARKRPWPQLRLP